MFGGKNNPGAFVRTRVSSTERSLSWVILALIATLGVAVFFKGQRFDPGLFALDPTLLPATVPQQQEPARVPGAFPLAPAAKTTGLLDGISPEGWRLMGAVERFTPDNLYEKINGRAEQYLAYDVAGLACVSLADSQDRFLDIFVYDMGLPENAFGIYSVERSAGSPAVELGREGYRSQSSYFFWKGASYIQILGSTRDEDLIRAGETIAKTVESRISDSGEPIWITSALPAQNQVPASLRYFKKNALSLDFLTNTCTARYLKDDLEITAFLSRQPSPDTAEQTFSAYTAYLQDYGTLVGQNQENGAHLITGDSGGYFDVIFRYQNLVGGVTMAEDRPLAEEIASELLAHLKAR